MSGKKFKFDHKAKARLAKHIISNGKTPDEPEAGDTMEEEVNEDTETGGKKAIPNAPVLAAPSGMPPPFLSNRRSRMEKAGRK